MHKAVLPTSRRLSRLLQGVLAASAMVLLAACSSSSETSIGVAEPAVATQQVSSSTGGDAATSDTDGATASDGDAAQPTVAAGQTAARDASDDGDGTSAEAGAAPAADAAAVDGASDDEQTADDPGAAVGGDDFCTVALALEESDPFEDESIVLFSKEFFDIAIETFDGIAAIAPSEVRGDIDTMSTMFTQMEAIAADYDYDLFDPALGEAMAVIDTTVADEASANLDRYLERECGMDMTPVETSEAPVVPGVGAAELEALEDLDFENLDDDDLAELNEMFLSQFDLSPELQACLLDNAGDLTAAAEDPSVLTKPICGTTLIEIFAGG